MHTRSHSTGLPVSTARRLWTLGVCALLLASVAACRPGRPDAPPEPSRQVVRVATSGDYPPFSAWPEAAETPTGFAPDLLGTWASATGRRIEWVRFGWPDLAEATRAGAFDLAAGGITVRSDRSIIGTFGVPLATSGAVVLVPGAASLDLEKLAEPGRRIAVNRGGHLERVTRSRFPLAEILPTSPNAAVPGRLDAGEVEAVVTDTREAPLWRAERPDWKQLGPFTRDRKAVLATHGREALLAELDAWLLERPGSATLDALRTLHLGDDAGEAHVDVLVALVAAIDERLSLMPDVARFKQANGLAIEVPEREVQVLDAAWRTIEAVAKEGGRPAPAQAAVEAFYRAQIDAAKSIQRRVLAEDDLSIQRRVLADDDLQAAATPPDLDTELRPALIRIGARIARLVVALPAERNDSTPLVRDGLAARGLAAGEIEAIARTLDGLGEGAAARP